MAVTILPVSDASDGIGTGPVSSKNAYRDDSFYLDKIAEKWAKERGLPQGVKYRLDRLPTGFVGYASQRENEPRHIDRYLYGHPNGHFRSMNELWPHFIHLQEQGGSVGCPCKLCTGKKTTRPKTNTNSSTKASSSKSGSLTSSSPGEQSRFFPPTTQQTYGPQKPPTKRRSNDDLPQGRLPSESPSSKRRKHMDDEGNPDIYHALIEELREAEKLEKDIIEQLSPDWRAGHALLHKTLDEWSVLPSFVPRVGELVLFVRNIVEESIGWDQSSQSLRRIDKASKAWLDRVKWEVGVVTQMPTETISADDLTSIPASKKAVAYSGFRVEPLSQPGNESKTFTKQHKYVPLHAIRPFWLWRDLCGDESEWHSTLKHALTVANSFSILGRYSFKGEWPEATVFARGVYMGPELFMVGDAVRLLPTKADSKPISDVFVITSIRLRFVKLDQTINGDYTSCLHLTGKAYTLDPKKSFGGIAVSPVEPGRNDVPAGLGGYGRWFSMLDLKDSKARLEIPFSRVHSRYIEYHAIKAWFQTPTELPPPPSSFQAVNSSSSSTPNKAKAGDISQGLPAIRVARKYSIQHDTRIDKDAGKSWFWAETRIEQLDLHEVNGRFVGVKDENRKKHLPAWRQALKLLDGKKGGFEQYQAARKERQEDTRDSVQAPPKAFGMMAAGLQDSGTEPEGEVEEEDEEDDGEMEIEADGRRAGFAIDLTEDGDDDDDRMVE